MEGYQPQNNFDAVIFLWSAISEIATKEVQLEILKKYRVYLRPNGLLYIDIEESRRPFAGRRFELINDEFNVRIKHPY